MGLREDFSEFESYLRKKITTNLQERAPEVYVEVPVEPLLHFTPLLQLLGYSLKDIDKAPPLAYARTNVRPDYRIRVPGGSGAELRWILELKEPGEPLERARYVGQLFDYMQHPDVNALFGVLFTGREAYLYVNEQLAKPKPPLGRRPVMRASLDKDAALFSLFDNLPQSALCTEPLKRARTLVKEAVKTDVGGKHEELRQAAIRAKVQSIKEAPPENVLLAVVEACSEDWDTSKFDLPSASDVEKHWSGEQSKPPVDVRRPGLNPELRRKVAEVCAKKGWDAIESAHQGAELRLQRRRREGFPACSSRSKRPAGTLRTGQRRARRAKNHRRVGPDTALRLNTFVAGTDDHLAPVPPTDPTDCCLVG